jgi:hypothetical protein
VGQIITGYPKHTIISINEKALFFYKYTIYRSFCVSTKSSIKNIDDNAIPSLSNNTFIQQNTKTKNMAIQRLSLLFFYISTRDETINQERFLNALAGPNENKIQK